MNKKAEVIKSLKVCRVGENRPWIYNEDGSLKNNIALIDAVELIDCIDFLDETDVPIELFETEEIIDCGNTYNWGGKITNDINWETIHANGVYYTRLMFHRCGDVRGNYTDYLYLETDYPTMWIEYFEDVITEYAICTRGSRNYKGYDFDIYPTPFSELYSVTLINSDGYWIEFSDYEIELTDNVYDGWIDKWGNKTNEYGFEIESGE